MLSDRQLELLNKTLHHIKKNNSFYYERLRFDGEIKSYDDMLKLPFLTKDDLRQGYPFGFACADKKDFMRMHMSSGTTGTPIINPMTENDINQWAEIMARCYKTATVTKEDIIQITPSFGLFNGGFGFHYGAERIKAFVIPVGPGRSFLQLKFMKDLGTTVLCSIASYPLRLIEIAEEEGFDFKKDSYLRVGIFGAEVWSDEMRRRIEYIMGIETFDIIGMTETGGVGLGIDCKEHNGIHVWDDHYIIEIIDPETGEPVNDGEEGEMVITTLTREGLPLIRYRTRDITKVVSREKCNCGLHTIKVDRIKGRTDDMLKIKGVNFYPSQIESILLQFNELSMEYLIILEDKKGKDDVTLLVEKENGADDEVFDKVYTKLYDFLGFHLNLKLVEKGTIERSQGKARRVLDKREKTN
ncbi:phenylacetate--CoA ligase [Deferribacter autotrophicus]|uniref:Phenylacetate-coenzyme A ligase n=1 Tax=Deferribacter autotrophicus TaxID=500465 RepID=A0A5A8F914_9BACT|nr:phenylacetate--CoA ligase [Deferribacter autotrophicus]KAA0259332.1 phenylacetate--CoA ligase [Deferribacter autotrophicus]